MTGPKTNNISDAIRHLIVCDTQFGWSGETTLKLPELLDLQARGWLIEGSENNEFSLTDEGQAVVERALQQAGPAELAEQQGVEIAAELRKELEKHRKVNGLSLTPYGRLLLKAAEALESRHTNRGGEVTGWTLVEGVAVYSVATCSGIEDQQFVRYSDYLAATGKQQVGEVQGDALVPVQPRALAASIAQLEALMEGECLDPLTTSESESVMLVLQELKRLQLVAARQPGVQEPVDDDWHLRGYTYASKQATTCAGCGKHKHTPLRIDAMGGYVCLTCIDQKLGALLGEFGYPPAQGIDLGQFSEPVHYWLHAISGYANARLLFGAAACAEYAAKAAEARRLLALIDSQRDAAPGVGNG